MQRPQLEHIIRAAAGITGATEIVVIGSQALLGQFPDAPAGLLVSIEADVFTFHNPADADLIDGSIGEGSPFHQTFGYYAHGVAEETALPSLVTAGGRRNLRGGSGASSTRWRRCRRGAASAASSPTRVWLCPLRPPGGVDLPAGAVFRLL